MKRRERVAKELKKANEIMNLQSCQQISTTYLFRITQTKNAFAMLKWV